MFSLLLHFSFVTFNLEATEFIANGHRMNVLLEYTVFGSGYWRDDDAPYCLLVRVENRDDDRRRRGRGFYHLFLVVPFDLCWSSTFPKLWLTQREELMVFGFGILRPVFVAGTIYVVVGDLDDVER